MRAIGSHLNPNRRKGCLQGMLAGVSLLFLSTIAQAAPSGAGARWWSEAAEQALNQAGTNRPELASALEQTPEADRKSVV